MKRILLFPLNQDTEVLLQNINSSCEYKITAVSSYKEDAKKIAEYQKLTSVYCSINFEECLQRVDAVVFAESVMGHEFYGYEERILKALEYNREIYINQSLLEKTKIDWKRKNIHVLQEHNLNKKNIEKKLLECSIPVLSVMGEGKNCNKFALQAKIRAVLEMKGYTVLSICSNYLGHFMGMEILPGFLFSNKVSLQTKIEQFNEWIYRLQKQSDADIILLGCPGGILPINDIEPNYYSEIPLAISNAVMIDEAILTVYEGIVYDEDSLENLANLCQFKYNTIVENFIVADNCFKTDYEAKKVNYYIYKNLSGGSNVPIASNITRVTFIENDNKVNQRVDDILSRFEDNFFSI